MKLCLYLHTHTTSLLLEYRKMTGKGERNHMQSLSAIPHPCVTSPSPTAPIAPTTVTPLSCVLVPLVYIPPLCVRTSTCTIGEVTVRSRLT